MCIAHLLLLLHSLLLVINARNKCVTLVWIIIMENDDFGYFLTHHTFSKSNLKAQII